MHPNIGWPNPSDAGEHIKCISTCVSQTSPMAASTNNSTQHVLIKPLICQREHKMYLNMCLPNPPMPAQTETPSPQVLTKPIPCHRGPKMNLISFWTIPSHVSEDTKCIPTSEVRNPSHANKHTKCKSTCDDQTQPMPSSTKNASQHELTKPQPGHIMHLNMHWPKSSHGWEYTKCISSLVDQSPTHASKKTKCISTCVDQTPHMQTMTQYVYQHVLA